MRYGRRYVSSFFQRIHPGCRIRLFNKGKVYVGKNCEFESGCDIQVHADAFLSIGEETYMNHYCIISAQKSIIIGSHCMLGPSVKIFDNDHEFSREEGVKTSLTKESIVIGNNCWLASNVVVLKGSKIGNNCVIGAGCIISGDIPDGSLVKLQRNQCVTMIRS